MIDSEYSRSNKGLSCKGKWAIAIVIGTFLVVAIGISSIPSAHCDTTFDSNKWKEGDAAIRGRMVCDLLGITKQYLGGPPGCEIKESRLNTMGREEIIKLLGIGAKDSKSTLGYHVGYLNRSDGYLVGDYTLIIDFTPDGVVKKIMLAG